MKRYRLLIWPIWLLIGMVFLAACQSDALPGEELGSGKQMVSHSDSSYINLRIVNNQQPKTRAAVAATAAENAVYDGIICIFEGATETTATLKTATVIDQLINNPGSVATSPNTYIDVQVTQRLATGTHAYNNKLFVLALLNTTSTGFSVDGNTLKLNGTSLTGKTIGYIRENCQINSVGSTDKHVGLFMSNAPQTGYVMPEVTNTYLFDTEAAAAAAATAATNCWITINVERAAARVKVSNTATTVSSFNLDNENSRHATVHRMTWALHNYNMKSYAIRNGSTAAANWATSVTGEGIPIAFVNSGKDAFDLYQQHSYMDGDDVYIAENTASAVNDQTQVFVEVQLKEGSFLLGDCYKYELWGTTIFFTSAEKFIKYCKDGWKDTFSQNGNYTAIKDKSADEVFKYYSFVINDDGTVKVSITNSSFTVEEQQALDRLSSILSGTLKGYRDGKMYFTYKIKHSDTQYGIVRNNAYNLTFTGISDIGDPVPTPIVVTP